MDEQFLSADKEALVDIVKISQRQAMRGSKGRWREFLRTRDRSLKVVNSIYDPAKRSVEDLIAFLQTFEEEEDLKVFARILLCHSNRKVIAQMAENSGEVESPQQKLVRLTLEHPEYPLNYSFPSHREDWMVTKLGNLSKAVKSNEMIAVDCEMVLCEDETEAVVKVCVVDQNLEVKLNELVNPNKAVSDYRTNITGISAEDLEGVTCSLEDIQKSMKKLLRHGTILIGHSLNSDLQALKLDHARVIDTSLVFTSLDGPSRRRSSLNDLCKSMLGHGIRKKDAVHNCMDDAQAVMKLVLSKIGGGSDKTKAKDRKNVLSEIPPATKLFLHDIPKSVPKAELRKIFPADITVKIETNGKVRAKKYSAIAIFTNPQEAHEAFESIKSSEGKDSFGRPQKLASLELSTGLPATLQVRKWEADSPRDSSAAPKKRSIEVEETTEESKRQKIDSQINPENNEVERLKQDLQNKDKEIATLQKIVAALTRKQGL